jgi:hypothetical protein
MIATTDTTVEWVLQLNDGPVYLADDMTCGTYHLDEAKRFADKPSGMIGTAVEVTVKTTITRG